MSPLDGAPLTAAERQVLAAIEGSQPPAAPRAFCSPAVMLIFCTWGVALCFGFGWALQYEMTATGTHSPAETWPSDTRLLLASSRPTLLMFVHPKCPCSRASLSELREFLSSDPGTVAVRAVFLHPAETLPGWHKTRNWQIAGEIPGCERIDDQSGQEHHRFGASASGEVFVYLPNGKLRFHGGITGGRGHAGENPGREALETALRTPGDDVVRTPVFGCHLEQPVPNPDSVRPAEDFP